MIWKTSKNSFN